MKTSVLALACVVATLTTVHAATFTVVNTNSAGAGSLAQAITDANASAGDDVIAFAITNLSLTIRPSAALPTITEPVTIDGRSQSGFVSAPIVEISGGSAGAAVDGLKIATSNSVISALVINGFLGDGIEITNGANNIVEGCYIGLNRTGATDSGNTLNGVLITNSAANVIGGLGDTNRNFIAGNNQSGIAVGGASSVSNSILGNVIGLNATNNAVVNSVDGIRVNAPFTSIGNGTTAGRNIISGNTGDGIESVAPLGTNMVVRGNWIGVDTNGVLDRGNSANGILASAGASIIGGSGAGEGNIITGNNDDGIELNGLSSTNHVVRGNVIGSTSAFAANVINSGNGILITTSSRSNVIGGILAGEANTIYFNTGDGIGVAAANANTNNAFRGNLIFGNTASGIDLGAAGITANDNGDSDVGANQLQNFPVLTSVSNTATDVFISGTLNSRPSTTYAIDFYSSIEADTVLNGEGQFYIGSTNLATAADSNLTFTVSFPVALQGRHVSATATDPAGNTSEFSAAAASVSFATAQTFTVVNTNDSGGGSLREAINLANLTATTGNDTIQFAITNLSTTISLSSELPALADPVTIDGYTQPGAAVNMSATAFNGTVLVRLAGAGAGSGANGITIITSNCVVRGLIITGFTGTGADGVEITGAGANTIEGCLIGIDAASTDQGNAANGVFVSGSPNNIIGGTTPAARNVISGNNSDGVEISGAGATGNQVLGNLIGASLSGAVAVANSADGVLVTLAGANIIGGSAAGAGNLISGNGNDGIELTGVSTTNTTVLGNRIGTELTGASALANGVHGININTSSRSNVIGGVLAGAANTIAFNGQDGVNIAALAACTNNPIRGNAIFSNGTVSGELGIDLGAAGVTANDAGDPDTGANQLQNFPVLAWVTNTVSETVVSGSLNSKPSTTYTIDFYANTAPDTDGVGEGQYYLGSTNLTTAADSNVVFTISLPVVSLPARYVSATATDPFGNTSEFGTNVYAQSTVAGTTFTVVNTNDSGAGSLRQAILNANANISSGDTIAFAITNLSTVIFPASALPTIIDPVTIDGYTQPGAAVNTSATAFNGTVLVRIDGSFAPTGTDGLKFTIGNNTVRGLAVFDFLGTAGDGLDFSGGDNNVIQGNIIGLDVDGTDHGNGGNGILVTSSTNNLIGGSLPSQRNVISGNASEGIEVSGTTSTGLQIVGNLIGTDLTGTISRVNAGGGVLLTTIPGAVIGGATSGSRNLISGNTGTGIELASGCNATLIQGNFIGTDASGTLDLGNSTDGISITASSNSVISANVISGNTSDGIFISGATSRNNTIATNRIGTDVSGTVALGNSDNGVLISSAPFNTVGGASVADRNIISANFGDGIEITGATSSNNIVRFNLIGTDIGGTADLGNDDNGILIQTSAHDNAIGGSGNTIAFNTLDGIFVSGGTNNALRHNLIFSNGDLGIDLGTSGVTTNDVNDVDTGANQLQNFPVITAATNSTTNVVIVGTLQSTASTTFIVDFYSNYTPDDALHGQAEQYLGSITNATDGAGTLNFSADLATAVTGRYITATATDPFGNTSELAATYRATSVIPAQTFVVVNTNDSGAGSLREAITQANAALTSDNNQIEFNIPGAGPHVIQPLTRLPSLLNHATIAGDTQPGYSGTPLIVLNGALAGGTGTDGLQIGAGGCVVRALTINGFTGDGIELGVGGTNQVEACYIGLDATGTAVSPNSFNGIFITNSAANIIGGDLPGQRNYIAGNLQSGVHFGGTLSVSNLLANNVIGLNVAGAVRSNNLYGVTLRSPFNTIGGTNSTRRNFISGNGLYGMLIVTATASNNIIQGNYIGLDLTGTNSAGTQGHGVNMQDTAGNLIGGTVTGARNYIAGNSAVNLYMSGSTTRSNRIVGNYIGLSAAALPTTPGTEYGVYLSGAIQNFIGGTTAAERNIISGNTNLSGSVVVGTGVYIATSSSSTNFIQGNYIGTDPTGTFAIPNRDGIYVGGSGTVIGGSEPGAGNLISGNLQDGIETQVGDGGIIQGNKIGTDVTGALPLGNGSTSFSDGQGISVLNGSVGYLIGGTNSGEGNIIAFNKVYGIALSDTFTTGATRENAIWGNSVFSNGLKGITLFSSSPLVNDFGDGDNGPNRRQNYPVLALALTDTNTLTSISGTLNSLTNATFRIEFFDNDAAETNGYGEGQTFLGATDVTTDSSGNASFIFNHPAGLTYNHVVTATATDSNRSTSEFSASVRVLPWDSHDLGITVTDSPDPIGAGLSLFYTLTITNQGPTNATSVYVTNVLPAGVTFVNAAPSQGSASQSGGVVVCDLGVINSNAVATVNIEIIPPVIGVISNFANVVGEEFDHFSANDSDSELTTVLAITDVAVSTVESSDPVGSGQLLTYTTTVTNMGPSPSTSLTLQQNIVGNVVMLGATASAGTLQDFGTTFVVDFGGMAANGSATLTVTCLSMDTNTVTANASLTWGDYDPNTTNNTFIEQTTVTNGPGVLQFNQPARVVSEGSSAIVLIVERLYGTAGTVGATLATTNGAATAGADFSNTVVSVTFTNGETQKLVSVPIINDVATECNEDFTAHLINPTGGALVLLYTNCIINIFDNEVSSSGQIVTVSATDTNLPADSGNDNSFESSVSADGRYVVFSSVARNLANNDNNFTTDVFIRDLQSQTTELISENHFGSGSGDNQSDAAQISADGKFVVFDSFSSDLVSPDNNGLNDVFLRNVTAGTNILVSRNVSNTDGANSDSYSQPPYRSIISSNANSIVFSSYADDLTSDTDGNESEDVFLFDRASGTNRLISVNESGTETGNGTSFNPTVSGNGQVVAYASTSSNLTGDSDLNGTSDVFVHDLAHGTNVLISMNLSATSSANGISEEPYLSADGRFVTFHSTSTDLAVNDTNTRSDVYWQDRQSGVNVLVSVNTNGVAGNGVSSVRGISANGRYVVFTSRSTDLVTQGDPNFWYDVYVRDMFSNVTVLVSVNMAGTAAGDGYSQEPVISGDGTHVAFESYATDLSPAIASGSYLNVFVRNLTNNTTRLVSFRNGSTNAPNGDSYDAAISFGGRVTSFTGDVENTGGGGEAALMSFGSLFYTDIWAHTWPSNTTELVSVAGPSATANNYSYDHRVSGDGTHLAYATYASNLTAGDTNQTSDVYLYNIVTGSNRLVSVSTDGVTAGDWYSDVPDVSGDGRYVAFYSESANIVTNDTNNTGDIFRRDMLSGTTLLISVSTNGGAPIGNGSYDPDMTPDGRFIAFETRGTDLFPDDLNGTLDDIVVRDTLSNTVELVSINYAGSGSANSVSYDAVISDNGRFVAYESYSTNIVTGDTNGVYDVFVRDRLLGTNLLCSRSLSGSGPGDQDSYDAVISGNGLIVLFYSQATNLVAGDTNNSGDVFAFNTTTHAVQAVSVRTDGVPAGNVSSIYSISEDGRYVAFESSATNIVANDVNAEAVDIFLRDLVAGTTTLVSANCNTGASGNGSSASPQISRDGRYVVLSSTATDLASGSYSQTEDVFRYDRLTGEIKLVSQNRFVTGGGNGYSYQSSVSDDGGVVAFLSGANNLVAEDNNNQEDIFVWTPALGGAQPDLAMDKAASTGTVGECLNFTYTLAVTNNGSATATGVTVTDVLPAAVTFVSATTSQGTVTNSGGTVTASIGSLAIGNGASVTITVTAVIPGSVTNTASAASANGEATPANNSDAVTVTITPLTPPTLTVTPTNASQLLITWPNSTPNVFVVETTTDLAPTILWTSVTNTISDNGTVKSVLIEITTTEAERYYRLKK